MARNEKTSARVASDAGRIMRAAARPIERGASVAIAQTVWLACRRVAASALTQTADAGKLERAHTAIRELNDLCESRFEDSRDLSRLLWKLRARMPGKLKLATTDRERALFRQLLRDKAHEFLWSPKRKRSAKRKRTRQ